MMYGTTSKEWGFSRPHLGASDSLPVIAERLYAAVEHLRESELAGVMAGDDEVVIDALNAFDVYKQDEGKS